MNEDTETRGRDGFRARRLITVALSALRTVPFQDDLTLRRDGENRDFGNSAARRRLTASRPGSAKNELVDPSLST